MEEHCGDNCKYRHEHEIWCECKQSKKHEVSNHGRVRNKATKRILRPNHKGAYLRISIDSKTYFIHRLIAEAFLHQDDEKQICVNHINGKKKDNHVWNLEYATLSQNSRHAYATGLRKIKFRAIIQINKNTGEIINEFESMHVVLQKNPRFKRENISKALTGKREHAYDCIWKYKNDNRKRDYESTFTSGERWRSLPNDENVQISDRGRVRNIKTRRLYRLNQTHYSGYNQFRGKPVHVFVAKLFVENDDPMTKTVVDHIDRNRGNNDYRNLRWCTQQQNVEYACGKRVLQCDPLDGTVIQEFGSISAAARHVKRSFSCISDCLNGIQKTSGGYAWKYA